MIQKKGWLSKLQLEKIKRLEENGENNVEAQQEEQNRIGTAPIQQVTEWLKYGKDGIDQTRQYYRSRETKHVCKMCWANEER